MEENDEFLLMSNKYPDMRVLMNAVTEDNDEREDKEQIAAIGQLIADRTEDKDSPSKLSTAAFVNIANKLGIPVSKESLMDLAEKGVLSSVIKDVNPDEIQFKGQKDINPTEMTVDKAKKVVSRMAKRNAKKAIHGKYGEE